MPIENNIGKSEATWIKGEHLKATYDVVTSILKSLQDNPAKFPYGKGIFFYIELNAGAGRYAAANGEGEHVGSPLLWLEEAKLKGLKCFTRLMEIDPQNAQTLRDEVAGYEDAEVIEGDHRVTYRQVLAELQDVLSANPGHFLFGVVFGDPNGGELPVEIMSELMSVGGPRNRIDGLAYVSAANLKRARKAGESRGFEPKDSLLEMLKRLGREVILIRKPVGRHQWTMVLVTRWPDFPRLKKKGFEKVGTPEGDELLDLLNLTAAERGVNERPKVLTAPMPSTCDTQRFGQSARLLWSGRDGLVSIVDRAKQLKFTI